MAFINSNILTALQTYANRIFIINGKTKDSFVMPDYRYLRFELVLFDFLKRDLGYNSVAFIDHEGLFFWDTESATNLMTPKSVVSSKDSSRKMMKREKNITTRAPENNLINNASVRLRYDFSGSTTEIISKVRDMLRQNGKSHTAVVVLEKSFMLNIPKNDKVMVNFVGFLKDTLQNLPPENKNILIFAENSESELMLSQRYHESGLEDLFSCSQDEGGDNMKGIATYINLLAAEKEECEKLLTRLRVVDKREIDLSEKEQMATMIASWIKENDQDINVAYSKLIKCSTIIDVKSLSKIINKQMEKSAEEQMEEITGMEELKEKVKQNIDGALPANESALKYPERFGMTLNEVRPEAHIDHFALLGNPGTGKTKVARVIAKLIQEKGILPTGHFIEATRQDLVSQYLGDTAIKTRKMIEKALGGVLFIDEAYALKEETNDQYGSECLATLVQAMSSLRGRFVLIMAGYPHEMRQMIAENKGMSRRLTIIEIPDYNDEELTEIMKNMIKGYDHDEEVIQNTQTYVTSLLKEKPLGSDWGNAGEIESIVEEAKKNSRARNNGIIYLEKHDFPMPSYFEESYKTKAVTLNSLIGLNALKVKMKKLVSLVNYQKESNQDCIPGHYFFSGNTGTGKTTVAEIMANEFYKIGVLKTPRIVRRTAKDLIGRYVGHSEANTSKAFNEALGGILFIDEAHQLVDSGNYTFGAAVLDTLIPLLEKHRKEICVIFAGYPKPLEALFDYDQGIKGRIENIIEFEDYNPDEMLQILKIMLKNEYPKIVLDERYNNVIMDYFERVKTRDKETFANARAARNFMNKLVENYAHRTAEMKERGLEITDEDIEATIGDKKNDGT